MKTLQQFANSFARKNGWGRATEITISDDENLKEPRLGRTVEYGFRKNTTGQYVPNAYLANFGWKNTFYQHAVCEVIIPQKIAEQYR